MPFSDHRRLKSVKVIWSIALWLSNKKFSLVPLVTACCLFSVSHLYKLAIYSNTFGQGLKFSANDSIRNDYWVHDIINANYPAWQQIQATHRSQDPTIYPWERPSKHSHQTACPMQLHIELLAQTDHLARKDHRSMLQGRSNRLQIE